MTVSCLPCFAQPYRLINHTTLDAFLKGHGARRDVQALQGLLQRYVRRFAEWRRVWCGSSAIASAVMRQRERHRLLAKSGGGVRVRRGTHHTTGYRVPHNMLPDLSLPPALFRPVGEGVRGGQRSVRGSTQPVFLHR